MQIMHVTLGRAQRMQSRDLHRAAVSWLVHRWHHRRRELAISAITL
jgi:hypothetical protein